MLPGIRAYEQLGFRAFGTPGKMAAGIAITLQNIGGEKSLIHWLALCIWDFCAFFPPSQSILCKSVDCVRKHGMMIFFKFFFFKDGQDFSSMLH